MCCAPGGRPAPGRHGQGTFHRSFRWGHVRQLDRVSRELLARAWAAGAGPGDAPFTIDLDSTICETYGLAKEGARHHGYTGKRGYHPLLAIAAGTGDVLMARLREGRANTACGGAHFLRETVGRVRYAGANGRLTLRADSGFYTHGVVSVCRKMDVRFSITIRQHKSLRNLIEAIPEDAWTPIPYWMDGAADVAETTCTPFQSEPDAAPVRLIVGRVNPTPGSQLALFATYSYHGFITDRDGEMLELEADHRRHDVTLVSSGTPEGDRLLTRLADQGMPQALVALGFVDASELWEPWCLALHQGEIASVTITARLGPKGAEVGVATVPALRERGLAAAATAGWASHPSLRERALFYSADRTNVSSQRVAERLGLRFIGTSLRLT